MIFFALNMGGSGIAPSFASAYGAGLISRQKAVALFAVFVVLGALALGSRVAKTLSSGLLPGYLFTPQVALIILGSAALSLFIANVLKVPQSTSWVTVFAVFGAALHFDSLNPVATLQMVSLWLILPLVGFFLTFLFFRGIYPPRAANFWFYEKVHSRKKPIQYLAVISSCYVAFAIGANNVANAVGPLAGARLISPGLGLLLISPLFGLGGWLINDRTMKTVGREIVPLGLITSTIVAFITATLLIFASFLGFPQSLVQLNALAIMAVGTIKHEHILAAKEQAVRKMFAVWLVAPLLAGLLSYLTLSFRGI
ncbi:MAG: inorganic phosphate transporter family protein [Candidatus Margulisbacteria bacterium]|nr:inorganic phosphate transporter family protein [Candidatus Margulisiibacteriota bacterium]